MATHARKHMVEDAISLEREVVKKNRGNTSTDYDKCIICQTNRSAPSRKITSTERLLQALKARKDVVSTRLLTELQTNGKSELVYERKKFQTG